MTARRRPGPRSGTSQRFSRSSSVCTSESVRGKPGRPIIAVSPSASGSPGSRKCFRQRHHRVSRFAHRRAEVLVGRRLHPAAIVLLLRHQISQRFRDRRMLFPQADAEQRPYKLTCRIDGARAGAVVGMVPSAVGILECEQRPRLSLDLIRECFLSISHQAYSRWIRSWSVSIRRSAARSPRIVRNPGRGLGVADIARAPAELASSTRQIAPGESELAVERDHAIELVGGQVRPRLPGPLKERAETLDGLSSLGRRPGVQSRGGFPLASPGTGAGSR